MEQAELFQYATHTLDRLGVIYVVVGSVASAAYGEPRMTRDIDIVADLQPGQVDALCDAFPASDYYVSKDAIRDAIKHRSMFNIIHPSSGNKIDIVIPKDDPWSIQQLARRQRIQLMPSIEAYAARPEDIIIGKMIFYQEGGSEKHLRDIAGMLRLNPSGIDRPYIERWAESLQLRETWSAILQRLA